MLLIPAGDSTDWPLLSQLRIRNVIRSLPFVMLVHLSKLKLKFLVGYLKYYARLITRDDIMYQFNFYRIFAPVSGIIDEAYSSCTIFSPTIIPRHIYLGVHDGQGVHPYAPSTVLVFDSMVKKHAKQRVHHVRDFLLFRVLRMNVRHGYKPLLPYRHL